MNPSNPNQLFIGTYRLYRTDNARTPAASDVQWKTISGDLTTGCTGAAPNGARNCTISAIGVGGGQRRVHRLARRSRVPQHRRAGQRQPDVDAGRQERAAGTAGLAIAVDRSNYRTAYVAFNGFNAATPSRPGHVFRTLDGGAQAAPTSPANLPDAPVNSLIIDPSFPNTLYAGTDVGAFVTHDGGATWTALGTGFPLVAIWQLDLDPSHRVLAAGTHGRGAYTLADPATALPRSSCRRSTPASRSARRATWTTRSR